MIRHGDARSFDKLVRHGLVLVDFAEPWCGSCQLQLPILERLTQRMGDRIRVVWINVDEAPVLASHYNIMAIPTLILFKNGRMIRTFVGVPSERVLSREILMATATPAMAGLHPRV